MAVNKDIRKYIEEGDFPALEELWLARLGEALDDVDFFIAVARALKGAGEAPRAKALLELLDEELVAAERWTTRLALARAAGELLAPPTALHDAILGTLRRLHSGAPSLEALIAHLGLQRAVDDLPRTWDKVDRLQGLLRYDVGAVVWMKDKGVGLVVEVNLELESFKIEFAGQATLRVGFNAAAKLLEALPSDHVLRRRLEAPEERAALKRERPEELLLAVLAAKPEGLTAGQIRAALAGVVDAGEWAAWWAAARGSPRVLAAGTGTRQRYRAVASEEAAEAAIERAFHDTDLAGRLEIYRRHGARNPELDARFAAELERLAGATGETESELAFAVAWALTDVSRRTPGGAWTPAERLAASPDPATLIAGFGDRALRERAYRWLRDHRPDVADVLSRALRLEADVRLCELLAGWLSELAPEALAGFAEEALRQPRRFPAGFAWLLEQADSRPDLLRRRPLRVLQHLLAALRQEEFKPHRARLQALCATGPLLPLLLASLDEAQASAAVPAIDRAPLEEYLRTPLLEALALRFPSLRQPAAAPLYALPASIADRREELRRLAEVEIPANRRAIEAARELGDLRENFEYKSARQRHEYLTARATALERELTLARPIDLGRDDRGEVRIAVRVRLSDGGQERMITILGPWESDPERATVSYDSDLGRALLGKRPGEEAEFAGRRLRVLAIEPWRSEAPG